MRRNECLLCTAQIAMSYTWNYLSIEPVAPGAPTGFTLASRIIRRRRRRGNIGSGGTSSGTGTGNNIMVANVIQPNDA